MVEGLGDLDDGRRGLPPTDEDIMQLDARLEGSDVQYSGLYDPDGVERDRRRTEYGMSVIRSEPIWFARGVGARRKGYDAPGVLLARPSPKVFTTGFCHGCFFAIGFARADGDRSA